MKNNFFYAYLITLMLISIPVSFSADLKFDNKEFKKNAGEKCAFKLFEGKNFAQEVLQVSLCAESFSDEIENKQYSMKKQLGFIDGVSNGIFVPGKFFKSLITDHIMGFFSDLLKKIKVGFVLIKAFFKENPITALGYTLLVLILIILTAFLLFFIEIFALFFNIGRLFYIPFLAGSQPLYLIGLVIGIFPFILFFILLLSTDLKQPKKATKKQLQKK